VNRAIPLLLVLAQIPRLASAELPRVAVFDLKSLGQVDPDTVGFFLEQVLTEIDATGEYRSFGRSDLQTMLGHEKMKEALGCDEESCMAEIAGSLGSRYLVAGSMARTQAGYLINLKFIDGKQGGAVRRINREIPDGLAELKRAARNMVRELLGLDAAISGLRGELALRVRPPQARYDIDDGLATGTLARDAPFTLVELPPGAHRVRLQAEGHEDLIEEVLIEADRVITLDRALLAARAKVERLEGTGMLDVVSRPEEAAEIYLDGVLQGRKTPTTLKEVPAGEHVLVLRKPLYKEWRQQVRVRPDALKRVDARMAPNFGRLELDSEPAGADVYLDGIKIGTTPLRRQRLEAKAYRIRLTSSLYHDREETVFVEPEQGFAGRFELAPAHGTLVIDSGEVEGARVLLDGEPRGETPFRGERLASRRYFVKVEQELYAAWEGYLTVGDGRTTTRQVTLEPRFGYLAVESTPPDAEVRVNERVLGRTPLREPLSTGAQQVVVDAGSLYRPARQRVVVAKDGETRLALELVARVGDLTVLSSVRDAAVQVDGKQRGQAPLHLEGVFIGEHRVRITAPHHDPTERTVTVREGQTVTVEVDLIRLLPEEEAARLLAAWKDERRPYFVSSVVIGVASMAAAVAGGVMIASSDDKASAADSLHHQLELPSTTNRDDADRLRQRVLDLDEQAAERRSWGAGLIIGGLVAAAAATVTFLAMPRKPELHIERGDASLRPLVGPGLAGAAAEVRW